MASEITCAIAYAGEEDPRIAGLGGRLWFKDSETVIADIEHGLEYYVQLGVARVSVIVAERDGTKYLRTDPDSTPANHLFSLPQCPRPPAHLRAEEGTRLVGQQAGDR